MSGTFTHRTKDIKGNSDLLNATRNQIRFTTVLRVWVFIGSAYFIVITQMSEKRDPEEMSLASLERKQGGGLKRQKRKKNMS